MRGSTGNEDARTVSIRAMLHFSVFDFGKVKNVNVEKAPKLGHIMLLCDADGYSVVQLI